MHPNASTSDTSPEAYAVQLEILRQMTPEKRIQMTIAWSQQLRNMAMDAIRRCHPEFDDAEVRLKFIEITYGVELANNVRRFLLEKSRGQ